MTRRSLAIALAALAVLPATAAAQPGDLFVLDRDDRQDGGGCPTQGRPFTVPAGTTTPVALGLEPVNYLADPRGVIIASDGFAYVVDPNAFEAGSPTCGGFPFAGTGGVIRIDPATGVQTAFASAGNFSNPSGIAQVPSTGEILVAEATALLPPSVTWGGGVIGLDSAGNQRVVAIPPAAGADSLDGSAIAVAPDGTVYVGDLDNGKIWKFTYVPGALPVELTLVSDDPNLTSVYALALRGNGHLLAARSGGSAGLVDVDPANTTTNANATDLTLSVQPTPSAVCPLQDPIPPFIKPEGLAPTPSGDVLIADANAPDPMYCSGHGTEGMVFRLDLSDNLHYAGGYELPLPGTTWNDPVGIAYVPNRAPTAAVTGPDTAVAGSPVTFDASGSSDPDARPLTFRWDLNGDGSFETDSGAAAAVSTIYPAGGARTIAVEVRDADGGAATATRSIAVSDPPPTPVPVPADPPGPPVVATTPPDPTTSILLPPSKQLSIANVIKNGLTLGVTCTDACDVTSELLMGASDAKKLGISAQRLIVIGKGSLKLAKAGKGRLRIRLTKKAKRRLRAAGLPVSSFEELVRIAARRKIKLTLRTTSRYKSGKKRTIRRKITLHA